MRMAVVGAGGTGGFFGGCLARSGVDVTFVARGRNLEALRSRGLRVESATLGTFHVPKVQATDDPAGLGPVDVVLFCVKDWDLEAAARQAQPLVGDGTMVIPILNGIEASTRLGNILGRDHVLGGLAYIESTLVEPGVVRHTSAKFDHLVYGPLDRSLWSAAVPLELPLGRGGFSVQLTPDIVPALWSKFVFICAVSGMSALTRQPFSALRAVPETRDTVRRAMEEVAAVAKARRVALPADLVKKQMDKLDALAPEGFSSMARDLEAGRRLELDAMNGTVVRLGKRLDVPTPVNEFLYSCLRPAAGGGARSDGMAGAPQKVETPSGRSLG